MLNKDLATFAKMSGLDCIFHNQGRVFATMTIDNEYNVRAATSYLGRASLSMAFDIYASVDPEAKRATTSKAEDSLNFRLSGIDDASFPDAQDALPDVSVQTAAPASVVAFTMEQPEAILAAAKRTEVQMRRVVTDVLGVIWRLAK